MSNDSGKWALFTVVLLSPVAIVLFGAVLKSAAPEPKMSHVRVVDRGGSLIAASNVEAGADVRLEVTGEVNCTDWKEAVSDSLSEINISDGTGEGEFTTESVDISEIGVEEHMHMHALYRVSIDDVRMLQTPKGPRWYADMTKLSDGSFLNGEFRKPVKQGVEACVGLGMEDGIEGVYPCGQGER